MKGDSADSRERLRRSYRPARVEWLFIGEAPPASGRFFYQRDSGLYRAFLEAFQIRFPRMAEGDFLDVFRSCGCYLIDLCPFPVDQLDAQARREACYASEVPLSRTIKTLEPARLATVVRSIRGNVKRAAFMAGWHVPALDLPYPGRWSKHREKFVSRLTPELKALKTSLY